MSKAHQFRRVSRYAPDDIVGDRLAVCSEYDRSVQRRNQMQQIANRLGGAAQFSPRQHLLIRTEQVVDQPHALRVAPGDLKQNIVDGQLYPFHHGWQVHSR